MRYLSVCSGYCAATIAWKPIGWTAAGFSEIEPFPRAVLKQRHGAVPVEWDHAHRPGSNVTPLFGDFTRIQSSHVGAIDLLVGGTPCQSFSLAGKRLGLDDPRGHLALEYLALAKRLRPRWLIWENVPGILSDDGGRTLGTFLGIMGQLGYGWSYRVLDAQYCRVDGHARAVPQRRRRVFVVGHLGDAARAAAVLFERESLRGDSAPRRQAGEGIAPTISARAKGGGGLGTDFDCDRGLIAATLDASYARLQGCSGQDANHGHNHLIAFGGNNCSGPIQVSTAVNAHGGPVGRLDFESEPFVTHALRAEGFDASEDGTGRGTPIVPVGFVPHNTAAMRAASGGSSRSYVGEQWAVRRLTPRECERLQGVPDDFTAITDRGKPAADAPRYKALGNSMAVNVMRWIGRGIEAVDAAAAPAASLREAA